jgi:hypothetical protein
MAHRIGTIASLALLIAALLIYRLIVNLTIGALGASVALLIVAGCFALACQIDRRERGH